MLVFGLKNANPLGGMYINLLATKDPPVADDSSIDSPAVADRFFTHNTPFAGEISPKSSCSSVVESV